MLMASLHSGEFATLVNSTGNLSLAALNVFFIQLGDKPVWCTYFVNEQLPIDWRNVEQPYRHLQTNLQDRKTNLRGRKAFTEVLI